MRSVGKLVLPATHHEHLVCVILTVTMQGLQLQASGLHLTGGEGEEKGFLHQLSNFIRNQKQTLPRYLGFDHQDCDTWPSVTSRETGKGYI